MAISDIMEQIQITTYTLIVMTILISHHQRVKCGKLSAYSITEI